MWAPFAESHSIERIRVVIALKQPLGQKKIRELQGSFEAAREGLGFDPLVETSGAALAFQFGPAGIVPLSDQGKNTLAGWQAKRSISPDFVAEALTLNTTDGPQGGATLTYESTEYTRWNVFAERLHKVLNPIVQSYMGHGDLATVFLEFYDRFNWTNQGSIGRPSDFLPALSIAMPSAAMDDGELWHMYRGWFEAGLHGKLLINQNFDCQDLQLNGQNVRTIQILTRAEGRVGFWDLENVPLGAHLDIMHDRTKEVFSNVLSDDMKRQIGIV